MLALLSASCRVARDIFTCVNYCVIRDDEAALAILDGVHELVMPVAGLVPRVRLGIATGIVVVGDLIGEATAQERNVLGETPNLAARLQSLADPGTVVIDTTTRRLAGGLFDYLPDEHATYLIKHAWSLLEPGGVFFFTNIARGNPYRPLIEYFGDWFLIERSEDDVLRLCHAAGISRDVVSITREETGLTLMIEARRA